MTVSCPHCAVPVDTAWCTRCGRDLRSAGPGPVDAPLDLPYGHGAPAPQAGLGSTVSTVTGPAGGAACQHCGAARLADVPFCTSCGRRVHPAAPVTEPAWWTEAPTPSETSRTAAPLPPAGLDGSGAAPAGAAVTGPEPGRRRAVVVGAAVLVLGGAAATAGVLLARSDTPPTTALTAAGATPAASRPPSAAPSAAATSTPSAPSAAGTADPEPSATAALPTAAAVPVPDPQAQALSELEAQSRVDRARRPAQAQWAAQLSSKYEGITDPRLVAANGTHTFGDADILAELQATQQRLAGSGATVLLLRSADYGKGQGRDGRDYWVTFAFAGFPSQTSVSAWCAQQFPGRDEADRKNACLPLYVTALRRPG